MTYTAATPSNLTKGQVFAIAESFAKQFGYAPGGDIHEFVRQIGGQVSVADTLLVDPQRSGSLYVEAPDDFRIVLAAHTGRSRDRFTIAHELGHYVLHYLWNPEKAGGRMMATRRGSDRIEWEANWFAAAFLMPEKEFRDSFAVAGGNLDIVANQFSVSTSAAEVRAKGLNLVA